MPLHDMVARVTARVKDRSRASRSSYLDRLERARQEGPLRSGLSCGNLAHVAAACSAGEKSALAEGRGAHLGIITAYNDMLSAHQPL
ncbi:MAG: phosphogluconate dehydratase, partial [Rhodospirillaceae bacterium]